MVVAADVVVEALCCLGERLLEGRVELEGERDGLRQASGRGARSAVVDLVLGQAVAQKLAVAAGRHAVHGRVLEAACSE